MSDELAELLRPLVAVDALAERFTLGSITVRSRPGEVFFNEEPDGYGVGLTVTVEHPRPAPGEIPEKGLSVIQQYLRVLRGRPHEVALDGSWLEAELKDVRGRKLAPSLRPRPGPALGTGRLFVDDLTAHFRFEKTFPRAELAALEISVEGAPTTFSLESTRPL